MKNSFDAIVSLDALSRGLRGKPKADPSLAVLAPFLRQGRRDDNPGRIVARKYTSVAAGTSKHAGLPFDFSQGQKAPRNIVG